MSVEPVLLGDRATVGLHEVVADAAQLTRVDRKYLLDVATAQRLVDHLPPQFRVLTIAGRHHTSYRSTYFDTADLATARAHVQQRRRRWKARSRIYVEDGLCRVEVKARDGRGVTRKTVVDADPESYGRLGEAAVDFLTATLAEAHLDTDVHALRPTAEVAYRRITLADTASDPSRVTIDWQVRSTLDGHQVWLDDAFALVETKGGLRPGRADRLLLDLGVRPRSFSKYVATASLLRDDLADNDVRRLLGHALHTGEVAVA